MEIKTLLQHQDEAAKKHGFKSIDEALSGATNIRLSIIYSEAAEAYAYQMCEAQKKKCAENYKKGGAIYNNVIETPNVCNPKTKDNE